MKRIADRVAERARRADPGRAVRTLAALPFYAIGWVAGTAWFVLAWVWASVVVGFADGARRG